MIIENGFSNNYNQSYNTGYLNYNPNMAAMGKILIKIDIKSELLLAVNNLFYKAEYNQIITFINDRYPSVKLF